MRLANANDDANGDPNANAYAYLDTYGYGCGHRYSYVWYHSNTHADVFGRQSIHDKPDWRQYRAGHDRHRQSRG